MQIGNAPMSFAVVTFLFAFQRFVPEQTLPWKRLRPGAVVTAVLFTAGKYLLGLYPECQCRLALMAPPVRWWSF